MSSYLIESVHYAKSSQSVLEIKFTNGETRKIKRTDIISKALPMPGMWLADCQRTCRSKTKGDVCKATYRPNKLTPTPCQGQFYIVRAPEHLQIKAPGTKLKRMREKESRIIDQILERKRVANQWTLKLRGGDTVTVKKSMILGYNWPQVGKYFIPCNMICTNRGGLCTKGYGTERPECQQQFFYVKSQIKVNAEKRLQSKEK